LEDRLQRGRVRLKWDYNVSPLPPEGGQHDGHARRQPERLDNAPLDYAPQNELGVVFLFSHLARRRCGLRVQQIKAGYPDCIATKGGKRVRIEFEYRSRSFKSHRHEAKKCDWLVAGSTTGLPYRSTST